MGVKSERDVGSFGSVTARGHDSNQAGIVLLQREMLGLKSCFVARGIPPW